MTVRYGGTAALLDLDLRIEPGEIVALVGPSGAGKSSLIGLLNGSVPHDAGSVHVLGQQLGALRPRAMRRVQGRIGTVYQDFRLVDELRVIHNVNAGRLGQWSTPRALTSLWSWSPRVDEATEFALRRVGIPDKLYTRTKTLSGGERQRVAIARVLVQAPELILADEPISSLDPARGRDILELLCSVARESRATLVTSLHDFELARELCERVVGIRDGRIHFDGPPAALEAEDIAALYELDEP